MTGAPELRALVVETDPGLREVFETLLEGWGLRFVRDPRVAPDPPADDVDLVVIDEDYTEWSGGRTPEWLDALTRRLPTIVIRTAAAPRRVHSALLILPKPFPVSGFLGFADAVRRSKTSAPLPPEASA